MAGTADDPREDTVAEILQHWAGGKPLASSGDRAGDVTDPATGAVSRQVVFASEADVERVIGAAARPTRAGGTPR